MNVEPYRLPALAADVGGPSPARSQESPGLQLILRKYCASLSESPWDAEDLAQDVWLKALQAPAFGSHPNPEAYLLRIAKSVWIDRGRRQARYRIVERLARAASPASREEETYGLETLFRALVLRLPPLQRAVFLSRDVIGFSAAETARKLRTTEGAVKAALHRARHNLRRVREDLTDEERPEAGLESDDSDLKAYLRALVLAYGAGDADRILELAQRIENEPAAAIAYAHSRKPQVSRSSRRAGPAEASGPILLLAC